MAKNTTKTPSKSVSTKPYVVAITDDGTIQITYTIAFDRIKKVKSEVLEHHSDHVQVKGFRKGKAPASLASSQISESHLIEDTLGKILPDMLAETLKAEKWRLAIYPRFELVSTKDNEPWQVRATTCEIPKVELGNYKKEIAGKLRSTSLWTPKKGDKKDAKEPTREEKEHTVVHAILEMAKVKVPSILVSEEVNSRLSKLLERIERLGLSFEQYIASLGKTPEVLRAEYEKQSKEALILDLSILQIAEKEGVTVSDSEVDAAIAASAADPKLAQRMNSPEQRTVVKTILIKRKALDKLVSH